MKRAPAEASAMLSSSDDRAGGVFMGILIAFGSLVIAAAAVMFELILQTAVDMKSETDITVWGPPACQCLANAARLCRDADLSKSRGILVRRTPRFCYASA